MSVCVPAYFVQNSAETWLKLSLMLMFVMSVMKHITLCT